MPNDPAWSEDQLHNPHVVADKAARVKRMFAAIAPSYDLNNRLHSLWQDQRWRKRTVQLATLQPEDVVVDVACGTGDLSLAFAGELMRQRQGPLKCGQVVGIDFTYEMLPFARDKAAAMRPLSTDQQGASPQDVQAMQFIAGDAQRLPLPDQCCDVVSIAFGIRNVADPAAAVREFYRILRPGGRLMILEFSLPANPLLRSAYNFYFRHILPRTASLIARDRSGAYRYLPQSVNSFLGREQMLDLMREAGYGDLQATALTFGVAVCYRGVRK